MLVIVTGFSFLIAGVPETLQPKHAERWKACFQHGWTWPDVYGALAGYEGLENYLIVKQNVPRDLANLLCREAMARVPKLSRQQAHHLECLSMSQSATPPNVPTPGMCHQQHHGPFVASLGCFIV